MSLVCFMSLASVADAQKSGEVTEILTVTVGEGFGYESSASLDGTPFGSISSATTIDGLTYTALRDYPCSLKGGCGSYHFTMFCVEGFAANPGQGWLVQATASGHTYLGSSATTYEWLPAAKGEACWDVMGAGPAFEGHTTVATTLTHLSNAGWITPKFQIVGITYAPPGSKSTANYSTGYLSGTGTKNTSTFKTSVSYSDKITGGFDLFGLLNGTVTNTISAGWSQEQSSENTLSVVEQYSTGLVVPGPASSGVGVDHDYDTVYVWLNPAVQIVLNGSLVGFGGYNWDGRDPITGMDVVPVTVGQLRGTQTIPADLSARLQRTWDSNLGALTSADLLAIAATDPFYGNPSFDPNTDTSHRYELPNGNDLIINYVPVPAGGQGTGQLYTSSYSTTSAAGQTATQEFTTSYAVAGDASGDFILTLGGVVTISGTYTYTNQSSSTLTSGSTQTANFTIYPPLASDNYTGPTAIQVWKDNIYGTFMFYPE
jgi:hypothetical protein